MRTDIQRVAARELQVGDTLCFDNPRHDVQIGRISETRDGWIGFHSDDDTLSTYREPGDTVWRLAPAETVRRGFWAEPDPTGPGAVIGDADGVYVRTVPEIGRAAGDLERAQRIRDCLNACIGVDPLQPDALAVLRQQHEALQARERDLLALLRDWMRQPATADADVIARTVLAINGGAIPLSRVVYLTNGLGEPTGYGSLAVTEDDVDKVAFDAGPDCVLAYLAEIDGNTYVVGNLEVSYQDASWPPSYNTQHAGEDAIDSYCRQMMADISARPGPHRVISLADDMPGRKVVGVAIPLSAVATADASRAALASAFGDYAKLGGYPAPEPVAVAPGM
jgi:hypothetical protein